MWGQPSEFPLCVASKPLGLCSEHTHTHTHPLTHLFPRWAIGIVPRLSPQVRLFWAVLTSQPFVLPPLLGWLPPPLPCWQMHEAFPTCSACATRDSSAGHPSCTAFLLVQGEKDRVWREASSTDREHLCLKRAERAVGWLCLDFPEAWETGTSGRAVLEGWGGDLSLTSPTVLRPSPLGWAGGPSPLSWPCPRTGIGGCDEC